MLVAQVALGSTCDFKTVNSSLTEPPAGYNSCHGVRTSPVVETDFQDDEYVIYSANQQQIRYVIEFLQPDDFAPPTPPSGGFVGQSKRTHYAEPPAPAPAGAVEPDVPAAKAKEQKEAGLMSNDGAGKCHSLLYC